MIDEEMVIDQKLMKKILAKAKKIKREIEDLRKICAEDMFILFYPGEFEMYTDALPQLKAEYGGQIYRSKYPNGTFDAFMEVDGIMFHSNFVNSEEWDRYE